MRIKITRIEIWEVELADNDNNEFDKTNIPDFNDSVQDDILNSQDSYHVTDDENFNFTPRELVTLTIEEVK